MKNNNEFSIIKFILTIIINAIVIIMATKIFKGFEVTSFFYAILTAILLMIMDITIKPFLKVITLPINIMTLGITTPFVNVIILKLASLILKPNFIVKGWIVPFFIAIFISFMTILLDRIITKKVVR